jgi:hypothetical protein
MDSQRRPFPGRDGIHDPRGPRHDITGDKDRRIPKPPASVGHQASSIEQRLRQESEIGLLTDSLDDGVG